MDTFTETENWTRFVDEEAQAPARHPLPILHWTPTEQPHQRATLFRCVLTRTEHVGAPWEPHDSNDSQIFL